jgi:hypothetical protein
MDKMIQGDKYVHTVKEFYGFLETEFGMKLQKATISGNYYYIVEYTDDKMRISIYYENIGSYFSVNISLLENGKLQDYDDKRYTIHLNKLNTLIFPLIPENEITLNNVQFEHFSVQNAVGKMLLKSAKELRICLGYLTAINFKFRYWE